jgi:hypothetical protein
MNLTINLSLEETKPLGAPIVAKLVSSADSPEVSPFLRMESSTDIGAS